MRHFYPNFSPRHLLFPILAVFIVTVLVLQVNVSSQRPGDYRWPVQTPTPTLQYNVYLPFVTYWTYTRPTPSPEPTLRPTLPPWYWQ